ncbi:hypothetical protein GASC598I20_023600 [Gilliamella apicola SCGC AB-598-I20]|nr:hypothetical protein GASC598I20_023600 [Gilliamella apicola SCGC AB-598-I20]
MALVKPFVMYNNPPYSGGSLRVLRENDFIQPNVIQRDPNPLNKILFGYNGILSMPETLILGQGRFFHEGILYEGTKADPNFEISFPTFSRYTAEHLKLIDYYYHVTIKVEYCVFFDESDDPGFVNCTIYHARSIQSPDYKVKLNNPPSHLKLIHDELGRPINVKLEDDKFKYNGKTYKKYPTHSHSFMMDTNSNLDKKTLAYKLQCSIRSMKNSSKDLHPSLYYKYEIIAQKYRD